MRLSRGPSVFIDSGFMKTCDELVISMITLEEFRAKEATGSRYMPTDKSYANYNEIDLD